MGRFTEDQPQGYRAYLPTKSTVPGYGYIGFYGWAIVLSKTNRRDCRCVECRGTVKAGMGVYHKSYGHNGFVHLGCAKKMIHRHGEKMGFTENILSNLQACHLDHGKFSAQMVAESIKPFDPSLGVS